MLNRSVLLLTFFLPMALTFLLCYPIRPLAFLLNAVDRPDGGRHGHAAVTPRLGGLAIAAAMAFTLPFAVAFPSRLFAVLIGGCLLVFSGLCDDIYRLSPTTKLILQTAASIPAVLPAIPLPFLPLAILYTVVTINALNLIDGLDGLAAGYGASASLSLALIAFWGGRTALAPPLLVLGGACLGFLPHNFRQKRLFLGDTGSQLIGFCLSVFVLPLLPTATGAVCLVFAYPMAELLSSCLRRLRARRHPFTADRGHFHHRLLDLGLSPYRAVCELLSVAWLSDAVALALVISPLSALCLGGLGLTALAVRFRLTVWSQRSTSLRPTAPSS